MHQQPTPRISLLRERGRSCRAGWGAVSYEQPPDRRADIPAGPPPGWYRDPGGLQVVRWWDGGKWSAYTQPLPGMTQEDRQPYPNVTAPVSGKYGEVRQPSAGRHRQATAAQDDVGRAPTRRMRSSCLVRTARRSSRDPYWPNSPRNGPTSTPASRSSSLTRPGPQPQAHRGPRRRRNRKLWGALIGLSALTGIIVGVSMANEHNSPSARNAAATAAAASAPASASPSATASAAPSAYLDQAA